MGGVSVWCFDTSCGGDQRKTSQKDRMMDDGA